MPLYRWDGTPPLHLVGESPPLATASGSYTAVTDSSGVQPWEWSDTNLPWSYTSTTAWTSRIPAGATVVDIQTASTDFWTNLQNTVAAAGRRVIVRLGSGVHRLNAFRQVGTSGSATYAFGLYQTNLQGLVGQGPDKTYVQMDPGSMSAAQLTALSQMTAASFAPNQMGLMRIDGSSTSPAFLGGLTFRAADQQQLQSKAADVDALVPQAAPHQGVVFFANSTWVQSHVRYQAAGKAWNSQPPFEHANWTSQYGNGRTYNCEMDGRRSADLDPSQTRACGPLMLNNETYSLLQDSWYHHSNISRYAANDENRNTAALSTTSEVVRVKADQITNTRNVGADGVSRLGYTNATPFGWESSNAQINLTDCIIEQNNPFTDRQVAQHLQLTTVGSRVYSGGRMRVVRGIYRNTGFPTLNGFLCYRITSSPWQTEGYAATLNVTNEAGVRLQPHVVTGTWPPTAAALSAAGVTPDTHYIVRNS